MNGVRNLSCVAAFDFIALFLLKYFPLHIFGKLRASSTVENAKQDAQSKIFYLCQNPQKAKTTLQHRRHRAVGLSSLGLVTIIWPQQEKRAGGGTLTSQLPAISCRGQLTSVPSQTGTAAIQGTPSQRLPAGEPRACCDLLSARVSAPAPFQIEPHRNASFSSVYIIIPPTLTQRF